MLLDSENTVEAGYSDAPSLVSLEKTLHLIVVVEVFTMIEYDTDVSCSRSQDCLPLTAVDMDGSLSALLQPTFHKKSRD